MRSKPTTLTDTGTGVEFTRTVKGDVVVTTEIVPHPYRHLKDKAFVTLAPDLTALINHEFWEKRLGWTILQLPGGCELDVDDVELDRALEDIEECDHDGEDAASRRPDLFAPVPAEQRGDSVAILIPMVVNDADLPPLRVLVDQRVLETRCQRVEKYEGAHARDRDGGRSKMTTCRHTGAEYASIKCRSCLRRHWLTLESEAV